MKVKKALVNENEIEYTSKKSGDSIEINIDGISYTFDRSNLEKVACLKKGLTSHIWYENDIYKVEKLTAKSKSSSAAGGLNSPMPGKIFKTVVSEGSKVKSGDTILILEAMKMEHSIKAPYDGIVSKLHYNEGDIVDGGVPLAIVDKES